MEALKSKSQQKVEALRFFRYAESLDDGLLKTSHLDRSAYTWHHFSKSSFT